MMAATPATATSRTEAAASRSTLTGTGAVVKFMLRRDRIKLPAWARVTGALMLYFVSAIPAAYGTEQDPESLSQVF